MSHITFIFHKNYITQNLAQVMIIFKVDIRKFDTDPTSSFISTIFYPTIIYNIFTDIQYPKKTPKMMQLIVIVEKLKGNSYIKSV